MCWVRPGQSVGVQGSGLEIRDVHYNGILVAKRMHAPILFAEYRNSGTCYRDWKDADARFIASPPVRNTLGVPTPFLATTSCDVSQHATSAYGTCPFSSAPGSTFVAADCIGIPGGVAIETGDHVVLTRVAAGPRTRVLSVWSNGDIPTEFIATHGHQNAEPCITTTGVSTST